MGNQGMHYIPPCPTVSFLRAESLGFLLHLDMQLSLDFCKRGKGMEGRSDACGRLHSLLAGSASTFLFLPQGLMRERRAEKLEARNQENGKISQEIQEFGGQRSGLLDDEDGTIPRTSSGTQPHFNHLLCHARRVWWWWLRLTLDPRPEGLSHLPDGAMGWGFEIGLILAGDIIHQALLLFMKDPSVADETFISLGSLWREIRYLRSSLSMCGKALGRNRPSCLE